jgi:hypothetical protein
MGWIGLIWLRIGTSGWLLWTRKWTSGFHKMLGSTWVAAQLAAFQEGLSSMSGWVIRGIIRRYRISFRVTMPLLLVYTISNLQYIQYQCLFLHPTALTFSVNNHNMVNLSFYNYHLPALTVSVWAPHARMLSVVKTTFRRLASMTASRGWFYVVSLWVRLLWRCYLNWPLAIWMLLRLARRP